VVLEQSSDRTGCDATWVVGGPHPQPRSHRSGEPRARARPSPTATMFAQRPLAPWERGERVRSALAQ
jgi:hypothetical protein